MAIKEPKIDDLVSLLQIARFQFPSNEQNVIDAWRDLKNNLKETILK